MDLSQTVSEVEAFHSTPRQREKPTVPLTDVCVHARGSRNTPVDLFDAIFKGPFTATGTYTSSSDSSVQSQVPTPFSLRVADINKFAIEEDNQVTPPSVRIYFEGTVAWYEIVTPKTRYLPIFQEMKREASIWLWIQHRRSSHRAKPTKRPAWPSLKILQRFLPSHLQCGDDPFEKYHPYLIERIIQSHLSDECLAVGPEDVHPKWMDCQLAMDLEAKYPAIWRSVYDRVDRTLNQGPQIQESLPEPISPRSLRTKVQKPSRETCHLKHLCVSNVDKIKGTSDLVEVSELLLESMDLSDPWQSLTALEILEKFECHAEALLTDPTFINTLEDWPGLQDLKAFTDKKWWKHRSRAQQRHQQRLRQQTSPESSTEPQSVDAVSFDLSQEDSNVDVETPAMELPNRTGRKGRSSLRPRLSSVSHTPGTPTRRNDSDSDVLIDLNAVFSDDELQHIKVPRDLSSSLKTKPTNKRFSYEYPSTNASKRPRNARNEAAPENPPNPQAVSFKFGRGRPPLITVPIQVSPNTQRTTTFRCPFPQCTYVRTCAGSTAAKAEIDKHHSLHRTEIRDALDMLKDPFIIGGRVGGEKGNRLVRPIGGIDHIVERIEEMAKGLGSTPSKRLIIS